MSMTYELDTRTAETLRKIFIGGLNENTSDETLKGYFGQYGDIADAVVIKDAAKASRRFGFITFVNIESTNKCIAEKPHKVDGRDVDVKRAIPREAGQVTRSKKAFVGGLPKNANEAELIKEFHNCGLDVKITDVLLIKDKATNDCKGFGFVTFEDEDHVDKVATVHFYQWQGKKMEVKHAEPKPQDGNFRGGMGGGRGGMRGGRGGRGGNMGMGRGNFNQGASYGGGYGQQQAQWDNGYNSYNQQDYSQDYNSSYNYNNGSGYNSGYGYDQQYNQGGYNQGGGGGGRGGRGYHPYKR